MKLFKKKDKELSPDKMKKKYGYRITICDPLGKSPRELDTFGANKTRSNDGIIWITNEAKGFEEIFPLDNDYNVSASLEEIEKEIKIIKDTKIKPHENPLNRKQKLYQLEKLKKSLENPSGSFLKIDKDGMPHLTYVRYRTSFIPMKWDLDFATVHTPVEPLIKNVLIKEREKADKYKQNQQSIFTTGVIIWTVILLVWTGVMAYYSLNWFDKVDQSKIQELNKQIDMAAVVCNERAGFALNNFVEASEYSVNITQSMFDRLNPMVQNDVPVESVR